MKMITKKSSTLNPAHKKQKRGRIFETFSYYLLDTTCENFGIIAYLERKLQAISQQDVTRTVWIPIVKHQIENRE